MTSHRDPNPNTAAMPVRGTATGTECLARVARYLESYPDERHTLASLGALVGLSASRLQRRFKAAFGVSPRAYQDGLRMARLRASLKAGEGVTDAIFGAGYGSVSRVYGEATRSLGMAPRRYREGGRGETVHYACRMTALGPLLMAATARGVCFAQFGDTETELRQRLAAEFPAARIEPAGADATPELDDWVAALDAHLSASAPCPQLPLDLRGTAFQVQVWQCLQGIREGEVISYSELARRLGRPRAVRAAASACAANRISVLVPCHRVLRGDGGLGGYRWGLERKRALLAAEGRGC
ncbi:MAG: methylated-DNA--[protein]-cysteine S-methyltransferase [Marinobacter sp.]|uniref:bifunctional transcriptional activator/DNA repair enzyme AdaA n=1 Tax=Marinobacter sp. TaxID=50741 RepID=UPI00299EAA6C|nr:methylated-DNA--[protein]-cysteine S-methyltransferase [Marinobacter sp.]MDX1633902.1 methylated-DNA--[protein]-cysteine S-methyltransferase [Marinobacter sp.]